MAQRGTREFCDAIPGVFPATIFVYDGDLLLGEVGTDGTPLAAYTWGAAGLISRRDLVTNTTYWYHFGPQGETRQITNSSGTVVGTYVYDAYGALTGSSGTGADSFQYGGQFAYYTDLGGFVLCGARWYKPRLGRWLSRDPIEYEGGENLYAYCDGDPVGFVDPSGLDDCSVWGQLGNWDTWKRGLTTSAAALGHTLTVGIWDGGEYKNDPGFAQSAFFWQVAQMAGGGAIGLVKASAKRALTAAERLAINKATGASAENTMHASLMGVRQQVKGQRIVDIVSNGVGHEVKSSYVKYSKRAMKQIAKDVELMRIGKLKGVTWHFVESPTTGQIGADPRILAQLRNVGIIIRAH